MHTEIIFQEDRAAACTRPQNRQQLVASLPRTGSSSQIVVTRHDTKPVIP